MGKQERFVQGLGSCTALMGAENATTLTLYPNYNLHLWLSISVHQLLPDSLAHSSRSEPSSSPQRAPPSQPAALSLSISVSNLGYKAGPFCRQCLLKTQERAWLPRPSLLLLSHCPQPGEVRLLQDSAAAFGRVGSGISSP